MSAKDDFLFRMNGLSKSLENNAVTEALLTDREHNEVARILRNGLAVVGFAALEDFLKARSSEILQEIGTTGVRFPDLPEGLRNALTFEAVAALNYQLSIIDKSERVLYIQEHATKIASTSASPYQATEHAFGYDKANLNHETIKRILHCFMVNDPWGEMSTLASRLNLTALSLEESFKTAARRRHTSAHVATANVPRVDLQSFVKEAKAIAISFDALISTSLKTIRAYDMSYLSGTNKIRATNINLRLLRFVDNKWKEHVGNARRATAANTDKQILMRSATMRASANKDLLSIYDEVGQLENWYCN